MDSSSPPSPIPVLNEIFEDGKRNFVKSFELSKKKVNQLYFNVSRNVQTLTGRNPATAAVIAPTATTEIVVDDDGDQPVLTPTMAESSSINASYSASQVPGKANVSALMLKTWGKDTAVERRPWNITSAVSSISLSSSSTSSSSRSPSTNEGEADTPLHFDRSTISATSVFDIGSIGSRLLGPENNETESDKVDSGDSDRTTPMPSSTFSSESMPPQSALQQQQRQPPLVELEDVRKFVGNAINAWRKLRSLGLRESSWEDKMPWRNPRPSYLARGLQRPPEEFSSEKERHKYYRRARKRGRYLIGPTPTWSFIVADLALLYFLIDNPAGKFLL